MHSLGRALTHITETMEAGSPPPMVTSYIDSVRLVPDFVLTRA
jgi:hypothetical protein